MLYYEHVIKLFLSYKALEFIRIFFALSLTVLLFGSGHRAMPNLQFFHSSYTEVHSQDIFLFISLVFFIFFNQIRVWKFLNCSQSGLGLHFDHHLIYCVFSSAKYLKFSKQRNKCIAFTLRFSILSLKKMSALDHVYFLLQQSSTTWHQTTIYSTVYHILSLHLLSYCLFKRS